MRRPFRKSRFSYNYHFPFLLPPYVFQIREKLEQHMLSSVKLMYILTFQFSRQEVPDSGFASYYLTELIYFMTPV